jgi:hypothetical protein
MTEETLETQEVPSYQLRTRDIAVGIWITFLVLLSIDSMIIQWLPNVISGARLPLICFLILVPSRSANKITGIPELLVTFFSTIFISIQLISAYIGGDTPFIPSETYEDALYKIILNVIFISMIIPWLWFAFRRFESETIRKILVISSGIMYPIAILAQFSSRWANFFYLNAIVFMSLWLVISSIQLKMFYPSFRNKITNILYLTAFLILGTSFFILSVNRTSTTVTLARLGMDIWIYILYILIALFSEGFILTEAQTLSAVRTYNRIKDKEE